MQFLNANSQFRRQLNPDVPPKLEPDHPQALEKDRKLRYQHAADDSSRPSTAEGRHESGALANDVKLATQSRVEELADGKRWTIA